MPARPRRFDRAVDLRISAHPAQDRAGSGQAGGPFRTIRGAVTCLRLVGENHIKGIFTLKLYFPRFEPFGPAAIPFAAPGRIFRALK